MTFFLLALACSSTPEAPAEAPARTPAERSAAPGDVRPFCNPLDDLVSIEAKREGLIKGNAEARARAEAKRQQAIAALQKDFDHPPGVAEGLDALKRLPIAIDDPDHPPKNPPELALDDALKQVIGYIGPLCTPEE